MTTGKRFKCDCFLRLGYIFKKWSTCLYEIHMKRLGWKSREGTLKCKQRPTWHRCQLVKCLKAAIIYLIRHQDEQKHRKLNYTDTLKHKVGTVMFREGILCKTMVWHEFEIYNACIAENRSTPSQIQSTAEWWSDLRHTSQILLVSFLNNLRYEKK